MLLVGLTGGIGSGKSTVSEKLVRDGHPVIDADAITRELQQAGQPTLAAMVDEFGEAILLDDGNLDRAGLAARVFPDPDALARLNAIVHPAVGATIAHRLEELAGSDAVVILDVPLLIESGRDDLRAIVVVDIDPELAVQRLVCHRGFSEDDARARIQRQASREERRSRADFIIDNGGTLAELDQRVEELDHWLRQLKA